MKKSPCSWIAPFIQTSDSHRVESCFKMLSIFEDEVIKRSNFKLKQERKLGKIVINSLNDIVYCSLFTEEIRISSNQICKNQKNFSVSTYNNLLELINSYFI